MLLNTTKFAQRFKTQKSILAQAIRSSQRSSEKGLTLLECLVAIVVVTAVISAITPPIFLVTATRIQNRRADQAKQLAQGAVDRVRRLVEKGTYTNDQLNRLVPYTVGSNIQNESVPSEDRQLVDINGDGTNDFRVQVFRTAGVPDPTDPNGRPVVFKLGVRVYAYIPNSNEALETKPASLTMTSAQGSQRRRPLAVFYTDMAVSDTQDSLANYCRFSNNNTACNQ